MLIEVDAQQGPLIRKGRLLERGHFFERGCLNQIIMVRTDISGGQDMLIFCSRKEQTLALQEIISSGSEDHST